MYTAVDFEPDTEEEFEQPGAAEEVGGLEVRQDMFGRSQ